MIRGKILIVDDDNDLREALKAALTQDGHTLFEARDGVEGLQCAEKEHPDLILLDIQMPKMDGHEMLKHVRRSTWGKDVHVLFLTNSDDAANITYGVTEEGNDYIIKSQIDLADIRKRVKQHLGGYFDKA